FAPPEETAGEEYCEAGVNLAGQKQCSTCFGIPSPFEFDGTCPDSANHDGDGREIKSGPIVHCARWEVSEP
ncbi:MAG TPA: hypothetical protein VOB72_04165, partial [Candidatus Dormibacteraeota bacterium]|nr:hypothetical protein [Candidatus Dormibacteraeota bacterium]